MKKYNMKPKLLSENEKFGIWETFWPDIADPRNGLNLDQIDNANFVFCKVNDDCVIIQKNRFGLKGNVEFSIFEKYLNNAREFIHANNTNPLSNNPVIELSDPLPNIPYDYYDPFYNYIPERQSPPDSLAGGFWVWRKYLFGFVGRNTGVMLSPEWIEVLER
jgi:hypothetical protein